MPFYFLLSALWVAVDQVVKYLVRTYIPLYASVPFLPGMDLTYVQNTGAAFSLLSEHTWVLTPVSYTHLEIADHLRDKRTVVLNLEKTQKDVSRRLLDFLSGVAYAQEGKLSLIHI